MKLVLGHRREVARYLGAAAIVTARVAVSVLADEMTAIAPRFRLMLPHSAPGTTAARILDSAGAAYDQIALQLAYHPVAPIPISLEPERERWPEWAAAVNDGVVRLPVPRSMPASGLPADFERLLRHEMAHSFVAAKTGGNCPTWLQEGVSQWVEGAPPPREHDWLRRLARRSRLLPLVRLDAPFHALGEQQRRLAYVESRSVVEHMLDLSGRAGLLRLLELLGRGQPFESALADTMGLDYAGLQSSWERSLRVTTGH